VTVTYPTRSYPNTVGTATVTVLTNSGGSFAASMELTDASSTGESVSASDGAAHASSTIIVTPGPTYYVTLSVTPSSIGAYQNPAVVAENPTGNLVNDSTMAWPVTGYFNCFYGGYDYSTSGTTPDGSTMAEIWIPPATDSPYYGGCYQPLSLSVGQPYMVSAWVDAPAGMPVQLGVDGQTTYQPSPGYAQSEVWTATGGWEHIWDWFVYSGSSFRSVAFYAYALGNNAYYTQWTDVDVVPCFVLDGSVTDLWGNPEPPGTAVDITATTGYTDTYTSTVVTDGATGTFSDAGDIAVPGWATITATSNGMSASTSIDVY
jgi:hypothetical protein